MSGHGQRPHGGAVLHRITGCGHQPSAGPSLLQPGTPAQAVPQRLGSGDDQRLELAAGVRAGLYDGAAGGAAPAGPPWRPRWRGQARCSRASASRPARWRPGRRSGPAAATRPPGPIDLDHPLPMVDQKAGQPGPIAASPPGPRPAGLVPSTASRSSRACPARSLGTARWPARRQVGVQQGRGVAVAGGCRPR